MYRRGFTEYWESTTEWIIDEWKWSVSFLKKLANVSIIVFTGEENKKAWEYNLKLSTCTDKLSLNAHVLRKSYKFHILPNNAVILIVI